MDSTATIGSKVTREVAQISSLVWMVGKRPMRHRYMSKVRKQEVLWISPPIARALQ